MRDLTDLLNRILRSVEPSAEEKEGAQRSHHYLREILLTGKMESIIRYHFLSGSYPRATAIRPLDDVDIIFVVDPSHWKTPNFSDLPAPSAVLQTFERALARRYLETKLRVQRRSIRLQMQHLNVDVVPAVSADGEGSERLLIPDAENDTWIRSAPKIHGALATEINQRHGELFKPLVKLLKTWNLGVPEALRFKSFCVETIATRLFASAKLNSLQTGLVQFFDFVCYIGGDPCEFPWNDDRGMSLRLGNCVVPDTAEGMNVAASVTRQGRECFMRRAATSRDWILQAERARTWNSAESKIEKAFGSHLRELDW
ncbi:SMODS domain-containing nucleotidyltransferase [Melittangium boletus]|nr:nucleotidyltransferase [Melittangium boletus]